DPARAEPFHRLTVEQSDEERPDVALRTLGIDPGEVRTVVNTHLHWDHSSNNHLFPNARVRPGAFSAVKRTAPAHSPPAAT
ncbi:MBL fold metallo-hydrolase, partial [Nocardia farcinica]|uniref:MBL fold metallo-hydrolase n=1 Tax=Nocardia farcinica TaxID=37329 RepID=UPI0011457413